MKRLGKLPKVILLFVGSNILLFLIIGPWRYLALTQKGSYLHTLFFGWLQFLKRVIPQIQINVDLLIQATFGMLTFIAAGHYLCSWIYCHYVPDKKWPKRATIALLITTMILFITGMGSSAIVYNYSWLVTSGK